MEKSACTVVYIHFETIAFFDMRLRIVKIKFCSNISLQPVKFILKPKETSSQGLKGEREGTLGTGLLD